MFLWGLERFACVEDRNAESVTAAEDTILASPAISLLQSRWQVGFAAFSNGKVTQPVFPIE